MPGNPHCGGSIEIFSGFGRATAISGSARLARGIWRPVKHIPARPVFELGRSEEESIRTPQRRLSQKHLQRIFHRSGFCYLAQMGSHRQHRSINCPIASCIGWTC